MICITAYLTKQPLRGRPASPPPKPAAMGGVLRDILIAGRESQCVAVNSAWLAPLNPEERLWLTLVGIAGLQHPHTYRLMLLAAENPPKGLFSGIVDWWGRRTADSAILASERKATQWLGEAHFPTARTALQELKHAPGFLQDTWLPSFQAQEQAVEPG